MFPNLESLPDPGRPSAVERGLERWRETAEREQDKELARFAANFVLDADGRRLLEAVFGNSPFLTRCLLAEIGFVQRLVTDGFDHTFSILISELQAGAQETTETGTLMRLLRIAKRRGALLIALADIAGVWPLERTTGALSDLAETALSCALGHLLRAFDGFDSRGAEESETNSGLAVLGMGKLGGRELNYSSDIDLTLFYDAEHVADAERAQLQDRFNRLTKELVRILQERTPDGYVFRTDLRLRPDPGATPLVISMLAAETYYESLGQNWERAAYIKARPVAGDIDAGIGFLDRLKPFIWRKHLDFAAIQDIHSIKRQIAAHRGGHRIAVAGHDIKLGRGGIREIEFFAQTQQLIFGGRDPELRIPATCDALRALVAAGRLEPAVADELIDSYRFLRRVEHRLQMVEDQQTHTIPKDPDAVEALAIFLGYPDGARFSEDLLGHLHRVEDHYAELFAEAAPLSETGNLVFTGGDHDPETLKTIAEMGFQDSTRVSTIIRQWHHGRLRATSTVRAREILTELVPTLLAAMAKTADPDAALIKFNEFVAGLPAGVQLFSLFQANPELLDLVARIMGSAPYLAGRLSRSASLLDVMLDADSMDRAPTQAELSSSLREKLGAARDFEDVLDVSRRWTNERKFQLGMQMLLGVTDGNAAGAALAGIADVVLGEIQPAVEADFARRHGTIPEAGLCVIAFGKHGGRELMPGSDLDAVFVFDCPADAAGSDGERPLSQGHYFARLGQSLISAISAPTAEGRLYDMDLRLRPSGKNGPLVPKLDGFLRYQETDAWTWEHMALTRARPVTGPPVLRTRVMDEIARILRRPRDPDRLVADVARMRARLAAHHKARSIWNIKHWRGGLVDIEFLAQYLMLRHAAEHPDILDSNTTGALKRLGAAGCLRSDVAARLIDIMELWRRLHGILRLSFEGRLIEEEHIPDGLREILVRAGEAENFEDLKSNAAKSAQFAYDRFRELIEEPARVLPAGDENTEQMEGPL